MSQNIYTEAGYLKELLYTGGGPGDWQELGKFDETDVKNLSSPLLVTDGHALSGDFAHAFYLAINMTTGTSFDFSVYQYIADGAAAGHITGWYMIYTVNTVATNVFMTFKYDDTTNPFFPKLSRLYVGMDGAGVGAPEYDAKIYTPVRV